MLNALGQSVTIVPICQCDTPGFCQRHGIEKNEREWQLCKQINCTQEQHNRYFAAWEQGRYQGQPNAPQTDKERSQNFYVPARKTSGPGTELKKLLGKLGITVSEGCQCNRHADEMNRRGCDWCEQNVSTIVGWLKEESERRKKLAEHRPSLVERLPFSESLATRLVKRAIKNARKQMPTYSLEWAYGVTTVPSRLNTLLPQTMASLRNAGFDSPTLFIDGLDPRDASHYELWGCDAVFRYPPLGAFGNWILSLWELYLRKPQADRYVLFQDDFVTYRNLRQYLDRTEYPKSGYCNLYTFRENDQLIGRMNHKTGWFRASQNGRGAVALMFDVHALQQIVKAGNVVTKPHVAGEKWLKDGIDGAVISAASRCGLKEYCHNPGLVQHTGHESSIRGATQKLSESFRGEQFDALNLL